MIINCYNCIWDGNYGIGKSEFCENIFKNELAGPYIKMEVMNKNNDCKYYDRKWWRKLLRLT